MAQWAKGLLASRKTCVKNHGALIQMQRLGPIAPAQKSRDKKMLGTYCAARLGMASSRISRDLVSKH